MTAAAALALSLITYAQVNARPDMTLALGRVIQFDADGDGPLYMNLQPSLYVYEKSDLTAVITDFKIDVTNPQSVPSDHYDFSWRDEVKYVPDASNPGIFTENWDSDPQPVVVTQDSPKSPVIRFAMPNRSAVHSGTWDVTLTAERLQQDPLSIHFCVQLNEAGVKFLQRTLPPNRNSSAWILRRADQLSTDGNQKTETGSTPQSSECYS